MTNSHDKSMHPCLCIPFVPGLPEHWEIVSLLTHARKSVPRAEGSFLRPFPTFPQRFLQQPQWRPFGSHHMDASERSRAYSAGRAGLFTPFHLRSSWLSADRRSLKSGTAAATISVFTVPIRRQPTVSANSIVQRFSKCKPKKYHFFDICICRKHIRVPSSPFERLLVHFLNFNKSQAFHVGIGQTFQNLSSFQKKKRNIH